MRRYTKAWLLPLVVLTLLSYQNCSQKDGDSASSSGLSSHGSTGSTGGTSGTGSTAPGPAFFNSDVVPIMNAKCASCHNDPRFGGTGPLTIFNYAYMRGLMAQGPNAVNNPLINKVQSIVAHTGGSQCLNGLYQVPCKDFINWYTTEFTTSSTGIAGAITYIDNYGAVTGWAQDSNNPASTITVFFYGDGPVGTGTSLGSVTANQAGAGSGAGHYFSLALPGSFANGKQHTLYAYGISATANNLLPGAPKIYYAYTPRAAGQTYFNSTVLPKLNQCVGCHGTLTYAYEYNNLLSPTPDMGATATNNLLINKPSASVPHSGGNLCGSKSGSPCAEIQQWWTLEFQ